MTKRKFDMILRTAVILTALLMIVGAVCLLFRAQYNQYGVSHFLTITINRTQPQTYVGELEDRAVYLEQIDQNETYFCTVDAQSIPLNQAIQRRLVSINDWKHFAETVRCQRPPILSSKSERNLSRVGTVFCQGQGG